MPKQLTHKIAGLTLPLPIFLDPSSSILLARSALTESQLAFPVSTVALPAILLLSRYSKATLQQTETKYYSIFFILLISFVLILSSLSLQTSPQSIVYGIQWILPFFWFFYFATLKDQHDIETFFRYFIIGTLFGSIYTATAGLLEILMFGALMDQGRMTQNLILPGHYQLYVYIPTAIAFNSMIAFYAIKYKIVKKSNFTSITIITSTIAALVMTGAREGILVFLVGISGAYLIKSAKTLILTSIASTLLITGIALNFSAIQSSETLQEVRLINKFLNLQDKEKQFGGRDQMAELYLQVVEKSPYIGTSMLPPSISNPELGIDAPSAHNYYIDVLAWGGLVMAIILFPFLASILIISLSNIIRSIGSTSTPTLFLGSISLASMIYLLISSNLNVPLRQPLTGPIFLLLTYWLLTGHSTFTKSNHKNA